MQCTASYNRDLHHVKFYQNVIQVLRCIDFCILFFTTIVRCQVLSLYLRKVDIVHVIIIEIYFDLLSLQCVPYVFFFQINPKKSCLEQYVPKAVTVVSPSVQVLSMARLIEGIMLSPPTRNRLYKIL